MSVLSFHDAVRRMRQLLHKGDVADGCLLDAFLGGDPDAMAQLVGRYAGLVLGVCRRVLGNEHDAEDAFQATFLLLARDARKIRRGEALASWLYGTARRVALRALRDDARRRRREAACPGRAAADPANELSWREAQSALDEEVQRLPDVSRGAFLLCSREGLSLAEAGLRLGVPPGTVSSRLTAARKRLRERLSRRGVELTSALAPVAGVSERLLGLAVEAGLAARTGMLTSVSPHVRALVREGAPLKWACVAIVVTAAGVFALAGAVGAPKPAVAAAPPVARDLPADDITGRVLDAAGKPAAGATVSVAQGKAGATVKADAEGRFTLKLTDAERGRLGDLVASAPGYAPDWVALDDIAGPVTLRLAKDDVPITGRVIDLEGRPVAGVKVRVASLRRGPPEAIAALVEELGRSETTIYWPNRLKALNAPPGFSDVTTGKDGRFRLDGVGGDRLVTLTLEGAGMARAKVQVVTRVVKGKRLAHNYYFADFTHIAAPGRVVRGVVKEKGTGKPAAGIQVTVEANLAAWSSRGVSGKTDAAGKFHLAGLPQSETYTVTMEGAPYIKFHRQVPGEPGFAPLDLTLEVERALTLNVRVVDGRTGKPLRAFVQYGVRTSNRQLDRYPTFPRNTYWWSPTDDAGRREETVLPGPGVIGVRAVRDEYPRAVIDSPRTGNVFVYDVVPQSSMDVGDYHALIDINPDEKDPKTRELVVRLQPGRTVYGDVVGPDGKPITGVQVIGRAAVHTIALAYQLYGFHANEYPRLTTNRFEVVGLEPAKPRVVVFYDPERKLGRAVVFRGDEKGRQTVRLEPLVTLTGKLTDVESRPLPGVETWVGLARKLGLTHPRELDYGGGALRRESVKSGPDGAFRIDGLVVGMRYDVSMQLGPGTSDSVARGMEVPAGKDINLGKVKIVPSWR